MFIGLVLLLIGLASLVILIRIGGKSDGPGAIVFYIGAAGGVFGAGVILSSLRSKT
jgi:hypothetical protein